MWHRKQARGCFPSQISRDGEILIQEVAFAAWSYREWITTWSDETGYSRDRLIEKFSL